MARFGAGNAARTLCNGQWILLPEAILCFATIGRSPDQSHFSSGSGFVWVADRPYRVTQEFPEALPLEVRASQRNRRPMFLFVRAAAWCEFVFAGELAPSASYGAMHGRYAAADFDLPPTLPSAVWSRLGGPVAEDGTANTLHCDLEKASRAASVQERLSVLERVVAYWNGPPGPEDGPPPDELSGKTLPYPLQWWYEHYGTGEKILKCPGHLVSLAHPWARGEARAALGLGLMRSSGRRDCP